MNSLSWEEDLFDESRREGYGKRGLPQLEPRYKKNVIAYLWIYGILGIITGITNDAALSYYRLISPNLIDGLNIYNAISAILMSLLVASVHKIGYRKMLLILPPITAVFLTWTCVTTNQAAILTAYTISWTAIGVYDLMYPLMWTSYIPSQIRTKMFSVVMIVNLITQTIFTYVGGAAVVSFFSMLNHTSYGEASKLSAHPEAMNAVTLANYTNAYRILLLITAAVMMLAFFLAFFIHDLPADYRTEDKEPKTSRKKNWQMYKGLLTKQTVLWTLYIAGVQLGARLVVVYTPIYLNNYLHIPRDITSIITTFQMRPCWSVTSLLRFWSKRWERLFRLLPEPWPVLQLCFWWLMGAISVKA